MQMKQGEYTLRRKKLMKMKEGEYDLRRRKKKTDEKERW